MDFEYSLNQLSLLSNTSIDVNNKLEFLDLIFSDEYTVSRIMNLKNGSYQQGDFTLSVYDHMYLGKVIWLVSLQKQFYFYWICSNFYIKPLNIPHEVCWILDNFKFGEKYGF